MSEQGLPELISVMGQARSIVDAILAIDPAALEAVIARRQQAEQGKVYATAPPEAQRAGVILTETIKLLLFMHRELTARRITPHEMKVAAVHARRVLEGRGL